MSSVSAPFGFRPISHPSGVIRQDNLTNGIASAYGTALYTGTPVKRHTDGTLIATATGADSAIGVFQGWEGTDASGTYKILPYWPAGQTYTDDGKMKVYFTSDREITYEVQTNATVAATVVGEGANVQQAPTGSAYSGISAQTLSAVTGATAATFQILGLSEGYPNNNWGDSYVIVKVKISTYQGQVA
jgi:hypothetical protein